MALDGIFLYHLKNEIAQFAIDSRVDKIHQPSKDEIIINLRSRQGSKKLLLSCNADAARIHFTEFPPENPAKPPMFCLLLRKRLAGAWVTDIEQDNLERILKINFSGTDELGDKTNYSLIIEIMGKYSNIIFVGKDGKIIDSMKRVDENKSHIREVLPGVTYVAPPKQDKLNIFTDDIEKIREKIAQSRKGMYKAVMENAPACDIVVKAAAVADYRPETVSDNKIKKTSGFKEIKLEETTDIIAALGRYKAEKNMEGNGQNNRPFLCGFSMETQNVLGNSKAKLEKKNIDMIVANNLRTDGAGFGADTNIVTIITKDDFIELDKMSKFDVAHKIFDNILSMMDN